ncbi:MAG: hypothetical protein AB4058_04225 [Microcystaceae cyanobacterium]
MPKEYKQQISKLVEQIQSSEGESSQKKQLINQMLYLIQNYGQLSYYRSLIPHYLEGSYEEIYGEAQQRLFCWITKNIDHYDSNLGKFTTWINNKLRYIMLDVIGEFQHNTLNQVPIFSVEDLENSREVAQEDSDDLLLSEQVISIIKEDPEGTFKKTYPAKQPQANFQFLCLKRYEGYQWKELSKMLDLPVPSLSNFYQRRLRQFAPIIQAYLQ